MCLSKKHPQFCYYLLPVVALLSSCQVSEQWGPRQFSQNLTMNHAPSRSAPQYPVANPVPVPHRVSVATEERRSILGVPLPSFGAPKQSTAIRETRPTWTKPVETYASAQPVLSPAPVFQPPVVEPTLVKSVTRPVVRPVAKPPVLRSSVRGKVRLVNGLAVAPPDAPAVVHRAVAAGNRLQKLPYKWGGGHAKLNDDGYDCSGAVSYVLREAGLMKDQMTSRGFFNYGEPGEGDWITVWVRDGHVFMIIGGLRLDTGGSTTRTGPRWKTKKRSYKGLIPKHPAGL